MSQNGIDKVISDTHYIHRIMLSIIVSQLILISVFRLWPEMEQKEEVFYSFEREAFIVEEMIITHQANAPASPPKPQVPIPVPNDNVIEEEIEFPELEDFISSDPLSEELTTGQRGDEERISGNPERPPRVIKIFEPTFPAEARRAGVKAMVFVNFLVSREGLVKEAYISEIRLYDEKGKNYEVVQDIGYGLLEATIEAAYKWKFRPAKDEDELVGAYTQNSFIFGF